MASVTSSTKNVSLSKATAAVTNGTLFPASVNFGRGDVPQVCTTLYLDVVVTGSPTSFSVQIVGGIDGTSTYNLGSAVTAAGLTTLSALPGFTFWQANLTALAGGTSPTVRVTGVTAQ